MSRRERKYGCCYLETKFREECLDITDRETQLVEKVSVEELHDFLRFDRCYWNDQIVTDLFKNLRSQRSDWKHRPSWEDNVVCKVLE